jgi:hypothetical protein
VKKNFIYNYSLHGNYGFIIAESYLSIFSLQMAWLSALRRIAGISAGPLSDALRTELYTLVLGTISLPINVPGTNYNKGLHVLFLALHA